MGSACCVAARDGTIQSRPNREINSCNIRCSPTWSIRWENRGRVAGEESQETSVGWLSDGFYRNEGSDIKYESAYSSEEGCPLESLRIRPLKKSISEAGSPLENFPRHTWQKLPLPEGNTVHLRSPASDHSSSRTICMDGILEQVKKSTKSMVASYPSPAKLSVSLLSTSPPFASPLSSQSHLHAGSSTSSRWTLSSPGQQLSWQVSECRVPSLKSPNSISISVERPMLPLWNNDSTRGSQGGSSDDWSINAFPELMATSCTDSWSFNSESFGCTRGKITRCSSRISASAESQNCGVCLKLLSEKSVWSSQKIIANNKLSVVAILICGHVHHAECLESITPEVDKYDPPCPVCTHGEKQTLKLSEKVLEAGLDTKAKHINMKNRVVDSHLHGDSLAFDRPKDRMDEVNCTKMSSSSSMKGPLKKPFLKRHFHLDQSEENRY